MEKSKGRTKALLLVVLLLTITIGFAALSATLKINGTAGIKKNTWSVYWDSVGDIVKTETTTVNQAAVVDSNDNTLVNFNVLLTVPGDYYEFQVDAVNAGTLNAMLDVVSVVINDDPEEELPPYLKFSVKYADGTELEPNHLLAKADQSTTPSTPTRERYKVRIEFDSNITPQQLDNIPVGGENYDIKMEIPYKQADKDAVDPHATFTLPNGKTKDTLELDDELCVKDQCFTFVRYDGDNVVMLAKYNIKAGVNCSATKEGTNPIQWTHTIVDENDSDYGLQNEQYIGSTGSSVYPKTHYGVVSYSLSAWNQIEPLEKTYPYDVFDNIFKERYTNAPDFTRCQTSTCQNAFNVDGYSISYYVNLYGSKITAAPYNVQLENIRLLNKSEVENNFGCTLYGDCNGPIGNTSFWLGTAYSTSSVYTIGIISTGGQYSVSSYGAERIYGVRPVIVVNKNNL